jgi:hypothetical protein
MEFVRPGNSRGCFHGTHEWRCENQSHRGGRQMLARLMHLLNSGRREPEPWEVSVHDMIWIEDLSVADKVQMAVHRSPLEVVGFRYRDCEPKTVNCQLVDMHRTASHALGILFRRTHPSTTGTTCH